ncbi:hypothetical protein H9Q69_003696 [Fusarium xylarioides]|nr:hypothetical protein H9Q70_000079 [Fusarium xylarioides]KAG5785969.1 hypothetical protein H9Q73_000407 [Fusarium xylarioides]KAG5797227.1 hypothetical protein H9Q69_003696 [Fusarium xylarioides]
MSEHAVLDPASLKEFIASAFADDEEAEHARFAHIKLPLFRDPEIPWIKAIAQAFAGTFGDIGGKLMFVTTDNEWQMDPGILSSMEPPVDADKITFQSLLEYLRHTFLLVTTNGQYRWKNGTWDASTLPCDAILILHLDPSLHADCALALTGILQWARDMEILATTNIRILTMSTSDHLDYVTQLVRLRRPGYLIPSLDLSFGSDMPWVTQTSESSDEDGIVSDICGVVGVDVATSHIIISFEDTETIYDKLSESLRKIKGHAFAMRTIATDIDVLSNIREPPGAGAVILLRVPGDITLLPPVFYGYDNVHVIISDRLPSREAWHHKSRHVVDFYRYASNQERWAQLWWLQQPAEQRYLYCTRLPVHQVLETGFRHHHRIEDDQLGGFIAGIYDVKHWGIDCSRTIECFLGNGARVREMKKRLEAQRILSKNEFSLPDLEAKAFRSILPVVHYNYHLALFVAADCDATVRLLKVQLAALLTVRIEDIVIIVDDDLYTMVDNEEGHSQMMDYCMGSVRCLANKGSLWLALGLWRSHVLLTNSRLRQERIPHLESLAKTFDGLFQWDTVQATRASRLAQKMVNILQDEEVPVSGIAMVDEMEITLDKDQQFKMQSHLFRAYMHHLTASCIHEGRVLSVEFATMTEVNPVPGRRRLIAFTPYAALRDLEDGNCMFGINHGLQWEKGFRLTKDWVWIPQAVVAEWLAGTVPESDLFKLLSVTCMEVEQTVDECV